MTFNVKDFFLVVMFPLFLSAQDNDNTMSDIVRFDAVLRPVLFRSEFVSSGTLNNLRNYSALERYDSFGFPVFHSVVKRDLNFWETKLAQTEYYARYLNRELKSYILDHPEPQACRWNTSAMASRKKRL